MRIGRLWNLLLIPAFALVACEQPTAAPGVSPVDGTSASASAGAGAGTAPSEECDVTVDPGESVQDAVDAATADATVCVEPGTYEENVSVTSPVTLQGRTAPRGGDPATIDGWVSLDADGSGLRRMAVTRSDAVDAPSIDAFGIRVTADNTVVAGNVVHSLTGESAEFGAINGIQVFGGEALTDVEVTRNVVRDLRNDEVGGVAGVKLQADLTDVAVAGNRVTDLHGAGWGWGIVLTGSESAGNHPKDVTVTENTVERVNDGSVFDVFAGPNDGRDAVPFPGGAFGIDGGSQADEATLERNNLLAPNGVESKDGDDALVATCNWWGDRSGPTDDGNPGGSGTWALERDGATVEYTPWLNAPAPSNACVGGEKPGNAGGGPPAHAGGPQGGPPGQAGS